MITGPQPLPRPEGAIVVSPAMPDPLRVIARAPENATIYFTAGKYVDLQIIPKRGQTYMMEQGGVLTSQTLSYAFQCFDSPVDDVTIQNFTIDGYRPPKQCGVIQSGVQGKFGRHWRVTNCEVRNCIGGGGIVLLDYSHIRGCHIHHCDQIGVKLFGQSPSIVGSEIAYNNLNRKFAVNDEAGGSKFWATSGLLVADCHWHHNIGCGIWCDFENHGGWIVGNDCHDNTYNGIYQEIGGPMVIEHNTCTGNGAEFNEPGWLCGAGIAVEASHGVVVRNNVVSGNTNGIGLIATDRGKPEWQIRKVDVCRNQITMNKGATGICWYKCPPPWKGAEFRENKYELSGDAYFAWENKKLTLEEWRAAGND